MTEGLARCFAVSILAIEGPRDNLRSSLSEELSAGIL